VAAANPSGMATGGPTPKEVAAVNPMAGILEVTVGVPKAAVAAKPVGTTTGAPPNTAVDANPTAGCVRVTVGVPKLKVGMG
jgi:hypothetical protein